MVVLLLWAWLRVQPMERLAKKDSNLAAAFAFVAPALAAHDDKYRMDCMADDADDVAYRSCNATYHCCSNPNCCNDVFDCMLALSTLDTLDRLVALHDDSHSLDSLKLDRQNAQFISVHL